MKNVLYFTLTLLTFVMLAFVPNSFAEDTDYTVQVVYFHPNDIEPQKDSVDTLATVIKDVQQFYADEMERHGYGRKTFRLEMDANDDVILHYMKGNFDHTRYNDDIRSPNAADEIKSRLDHSKKIIYLIWVDRYDPDTGAGPVKGRGGIKPPGDRGTVWIFPHNFDSDIWWVYRDAWTTTAHELGHGFGLPHDFRKDSYIMSYGDDLRNELSACAAEWLSVHPYFNLNPRPPNQNTKVTLLEPTQGSKPYTVQLRFEVSDPDGLHQVLLDLEGDIELIDCKALSGNSTTIEFNTIVEGLSRFNVRLHVIDVNGSYYKSEKINVNVSHLMPPAEVVSIPDVNLASVIRETLRLAPNSPITQLDMLRITNRLIAHEREIIDLTGLEHAKNLKRLYLWGNQISDITPLTTLTELKELYLSGNQIRIIPSLAKMAQLRRLSLNGNPIHDITPLSELTELKQLYLQSNNITDISPLTELTQLWYLYLTDNQIQDITPLKGLNNLRILNLEANQIEDTRPLTDLVKLRELQLGDNKISDISPLAGLNRLVHLDLTDNQVSDISPLAGLNRLVHLELSGNQVSDVEPLAKLKNLNILNLGWNEISDISPLAGLTNLENLNIDQCRISDVTPLAELTNLERLTLNWNEISDVEPLAKLKNLNALYLIDNPIKDREPLLELLRKNPDIKIYLKNRGEPLPVNLSHFRAELTDSGIVLKWITESELDNAGFYIYRSQTKDGVFKVVNPTIIQGAGTTSERNEYTWTDTTAKPNTVYYYRIEDVSHAGEREQLATVRLRGLVSAKGKLLTQWADFKIGR